MKMKKKNIEKSHFMRVFYDYIIIIMIIIIIKPYSLL